MLAVLSSPSSLLDRLSLEGFFVARYLRSWRFDLYTSDLRGGLWGSVDAVVWGWGPSVAVVTGVKVAEGTGVFVNWGVSCCCCCLGSNMSIGGIEVGQLCMGCGICSH